MIKYLLDSNICIEILRGSNSVRRRLEQVNFEECAISYITMIELRVGVELAKLSIRYAKYRNQPIANLLSRITIIPIESSVDFFVREKARLQVAGTPVENNFDLLIGCTAVTEGLTMVTDNIKDFKNINGIKIENWIER